ncbi:hypothetical protein [uncultured Campylobacter sp.]|uniref:hypothetical protein n=1 Tax=uncultured Campylobacter sp. TaxID=218934 RepID=UPI0026118F58|nr:hypothetical protein [uncultured Campylobacter sp.]
MKKIALILCMTLNFVFAECKLYESADEMTDEKFHWTSCGSETFNINVFHMKKEIRPQKTNMYIIISDNIEGFLVERTKGNFGYQTIRIRIDKNKFFDVDADIMSGYYGKNTRASFFISPDQQKQLIEGKKILVRYITRQNKVNTESIDISTIKTPKQEDKK